MPDPMPAQGHEADPGARPGARPWLAIIGIGEDGRDGLSPAADAALARASVVFGGARHLALAGIGKHGRPWPVPFDLGPLLALRGQPVAVLASGDPFWFGAGGSLAQHLHPDEWQVYPAASCFGLAAARLGWRLEDVTCLGLHAAAFETLTPHLARQARLLVTLRDGAAVVALAGWLVAQGWGASRITALQALGGPKEAILTLPANRFARDVKPPGAPVLAAILCAGGDGLATTPGRPEALFAHDGQITKAPMRALTLAALAPRADAVLWDLGAGSGAIAVEWCLARGRAIAVEARADRCANIAENIRRFGLGARMSCRHGDSRDLLAGLPRPDAVFVGGGFDEALFHALGHVAADARLVVNAVTLATQALLCQLHAAHGGQLLRIDLAQAAVLGTGHGWQPARGLMQWTTVL